MRVHVEAFPFPLSSLAPCKFSHRFFLSIFDDPFSFQYMVKTILDGVNAAVAKNKPGEDMDSNIFAKVV